MADSICSNPKEDYKERPIIYQPVALPPHYQAIIDNEFNIVFDLTSNILTSIQGIFLTGEFIVDQALMEKLPNIKVISRFGVGIENLDITSASKNGIAVGICPCQESTADFAMGLLITVGRNIVMGNNICKDKSNNWNLNVPTFWSRGEINGATVGILGMGKLGLAIARRARAFSMRIHYHNRTRRSIEDEEQVNATYYAELHSMIPLCDYIIISAPGGPQTKGLFGPNEFELMQSHAILINIGRGSIVDHDALTKSILEGKIGGAGLDVTDPEPLPPDHPLLDCDNVILAPHIGSSTKATWTNMIETAIKTIKAGIKGEKLPYPVN